MALEVKSLRKMSHFRRTNEKLMTLMALLDSWVAAIGIALESAISNNLGHNACFDQRLIASFGNRKQGNNPIELIINSPIFFYLYVGGLIPRVIFLSICTLGFYLVNTYSNFYYYISDTGSYIPAT